MRSNIFGQADIRTSVTIEENQAEGITVYQLHTGEGRLAVRRTVDTALITDVVAFIERTSIFRSSLSAAVAQAKLFLFYSENESRTRDMCVSLGGRVDFNKVVSTSFYDLVGQLIKENEADSIARMLACLSALDQAGTHYGLYTIGRLLDTDVGQEAFGMLDMSALSSILDQASISKTDTVEATVKRLQSNPTYV